jgi:hypothetical protein
MPTDHIRCPGCGVTLPSSNQEMDTEFHASAACRQLCYELSYYTLSLHDEYFIHQLVVDTYAAQHADEHAKPIRTAFALIGLYLVCEKGYTGKQVQDAHKKLADQSKIWPIFSIPQKKARLTVADVLARSDEEKVSAIQEWCQSVWEIWKDEIQAIEELVNKYLPTQVGV